MAECVIAAANLKAFARFLTTLAKFNEEVFLDFAHASQLSMSCVNTAVSAYAMIKINHSPSAANSFFESYSGHPQPTGLCYKLLLKPLINIFKSGSHLDSIQQCRIKPVSEKSGQERLEVQLHCRFGVMKTHKFNYELVEPIKLVFSDNQDSRSQWMASPRMIHDLLSHFQQKLKEVTITCDVNLFSVRSHEETFVPDSTTIVRSLETEIRVDVTDFDLYHVFGEGDLTFELKDLKTVLAFAESIELPIKCTFDFEGGPLCFSCKPTSNSFEVDIVLAAAPKVGPRTESPHSARGRSAMPSQAGRPGSHMSHSPANASHHTMYATPLPAAPGQYSQYPQQQPQSVQRMAETEPSQLFQSGTFVMASQSEYRPLLGIHTDQEEILVPASPVSGDGEVDNSDDERERDRNPYSRVGRPGSGRGVLYMIEDDQAMGGGGDGDEEDEQPLQRRRVDSETTSDGLGGVLQGRRRRMVVDQSSENDRSDKSKGSLGRGQRGLVGAAGSNASSIVTGTTTGGHQGQAGQAQGQGGKRVRYSD
ncbi:Rad9-domain-containing protein [Entophlyctis helioformis]|nr:Rad9-domain-containing protein [Entophlyctis helioformis]